MKKLIILLLFIATTPIFGQSDSLNQAKIDSLCNVLPLNLSSTEVIRYGLTYDTWVSNDDFGISIANGWRRDTLNGDKGVHRNPFTSSDNDRYEKNQFKDSNTDCRYYRYKKGRKYTGKVSDTLFSIYQGEIIFNTNCINGMIQGKGTLILLSTKQIIASCSFEDGELIGECISVNRKTMGEYRFTYVKGNFQWTKMIELDKDGKVILVGEQ
ncbi:MAG: hypothetical protein Q8M29_09940 [Bacteroidota bacterium]|nr:hypothetical protein [Bacteroidota bacterium]